MRKIWPVLVGATLLLGGCASGGADATSTPTPTVSKNEAACGAFEDATIEVGNVVTQDPIDKDFDIPATFDEVALQAEGDVKERMLAVVDNLPDTPFMIVWMDNRDAYSEDLEAVQRACAAEGFDIQVARLVAANQ